MKKIILASSSPRRQKLLSTIINNFEVIPQSFDETKFELSPKSFSLQQLSLLKAKSIYLQDKSALIISADTVVIYENEIMGKPKSREDAFRMLKKLSGKTHYVMTGVAVLDYESKNSLTDCGITYVSFNELSDDEIYNYIDCKKPFDKAGSYGIQELPQNFVKDINGDFDNVVGLPIKILIKMIEKMQ
jgi:septum formation protein